MDRQIVYPGQIPLETDLLNTNKNTMIALAKLAAAMLGTATVVNGLACVPTGPASLQVVVNPGEMYSLANVDATAYSSIAADTTHSILKQGISLDAVTLNCAAPVTAGQSVNYLVQAAFIESDTGLVALPYYNASNPSQAWSGPGNTGNPQATARKGTVNITAKAGIAATTGSQTTPAPDAGYTGLYVVTVANGQSTITSANIVQATNAPILPTDLMHAIQGSSLVAAIATGSANTYAANYSPGITALTDGMVLWFKTTNTNTGASTLNVNGLGAKSIYGSGLVALQAGEVSGWCQVVWRADFNVFVLMDSTGGPLQVAAATQSQHAMQLGQAVGRYLGTRVFTTSQTYTPTAGTTSVVVEVVGGGAGGGNISATSSGQIGVGGGGGAGGYARSRLTSGFSGVSMTIGAGGGSATNGGTTSFGALLSATGGTSAGAGTVAAPPITAIGGAGGVGSSGNLLNTQGGYGTAAAGTSASSFTSGAGGVSVFGGGANALPTSTGAGIAAQSYGAGGGGAAGGANVSAQSGGAGGTGAIIIHEFA